MKRTVSIVFLLVAFLLTNWQVVGQTDYSSFELNYSFAGLGSNLGSMQPTIRVTGTSLVYTYEQNSYFGEPSRQPDTIQIKELETSTIDSILMIVAEISDSVIYETNPCIMSGGIHYLSVIHKSKTIKFTMHNTFHRKALLITNLINPLLPKDKKIWVSEAYIDEAIECWEYLRDLDEKD